MGVPYYIVVEEEEYGEYKAVCTGEVLVLPNSYKENYDTFWEDGDDRCGAGAARNFVWDH